MMRRMIGLSFSRCVAEIAAGKVAIDDVDKIYSRTATDDWEKTIDSYASYWEDIFPIVCKKKNNCIDFVAKCQQVGRQVLSIVIQPRLFDGKYPDCSRVFWVESEDEIVWRDDNTKAAQDIAAKRFGFY